MCQNCIETSIENIVDLTVRGYSLEVATRLYRDSVIQFYLMDAPDDGKPAECVLREARDLVTIITDASQALETARREKPKSYEALLQTRTLLMMLQAGS